MSKVILTQDQAEALESTLETHNEIKDQLVDKHLNHRDVWQGISEPLNDLSVSSLARALYIGYEVEPEFKVGDWVHRMSDKKIYKVDFVTEEGLILDDENLWMFNEQGIDFKKHTQIESVRHATPEEIKEEKDRRLFYRNGRKVWELRKNDILYNPWLGIRTVFHIRENGKVSFSEGHKEYEIDEIKESYRVACFAENRLDVKDDE